MDDRFAARLVEWQPFYATAATVAATLVGLLFVALSLNRDRLFADTTRAFRRLAARSFGDYLFVLGVAMVMLMPKQDAHGLGATLFALGLYRIVRVVRQQRGPVYAHARPRRARQVIAESGSVSV